ncbi:MAG: NADH-quinone oxidoreductase subunit L [Acidobacteria bacterium]|nr:NADH-quinone oxidoreductase subunit L [Acidobacteriota bacterium]
MRLLWLIPLLPFLGAFLNGVVLRDRLSKKGVWLIACGSVLASLIVAVLAISGYLGSELYAQHAAFEQALYEWIPAGVMGLDDGTFANVSFEMGFLLDPLSCVMVFVVTFVGFWIHWFSVGYMAHEPGFQRYFTYLNLFMGMMLMLVLGNNFLVTFVGWEGVGLCSYLLIGFYYDQDFPPFAGRKAFIVNRIGDFAFLAGLFALVDHFGTLNYQRLFEAIEQNPAGVQGEYVLGLSFAAFVALALFVGATGKSAQIPLYVWLPDAMAGPTPVSALIHAATMVTAGVYMVVRSNALYQLAPEISYVVAIIGALTAIFAATIAIAQTDIKKVLAYSTVSQLGYMFLACGVGAYSAAIFHLMTHAFFKGLMFLGSGSVIHAMGGEQDLRKMGGLKAHMPWTYRTFLIGTLAIAGVPGLAGFFSKDQILASTFGSNRLLWGVGLLTAGLTACYMFRLVFLAFHGKFRGTEEQQHHLHESPPSMTIPLMVLAAGAAISGYVGLPKLGHFDYNVFDHFVGRVVADVGAHEGHHLSVGLELVLMGLSVAVALSGIWLAWRYYGAGRGLTEGERWAARFPAIHRLLENKYWVDEAYDRTVVRGTWASAHGLFRFDSKFIDGVLVNGSRHVTVAAAVLSGFFDKYFVDGLVNLIGWASHATSRFFRGLQTGLVSQYALVLAIGTAVLVGFYYVVRLGS